MFEVRIYRLGITHDELRKNWTIKEGVSLLFSEICELVIIKPLFQHLELPFENLVFSKFRFTQDGIMVGISRGTICFSLEANPPDKSAKPHGTW